MASEKYQRIKTALDEIESALIAISNPTTKGELEEQKLAVKDIRKRLEMITRTMLTNMRDSVFQMAGKHRIGSSMVNFSNRLYPQSFVKLKHNGKTYTGVVTSVSDHGEDVHVDVLTERYVCEELIFRTNISKSGTAIVPYKTYERVGVEYVKPGDYVIVDDRLGRATSQAVWSPKRKHFKVQVVMQDAAGWSECEYSSKKHKFHEIAYRFSLNYIHDQIETSWSFMTLALAAQAPIFEALFHEHCGSYVLDPVNLVDELFDGLGKRTYATALLKIMRHLMPAARVNLYTAGKDHCGVVGFEGNSRLFLTKEGQQMISGGTGNYQIVSELSHVKDLIHRIERTLIAD